MPTVLDLPEAERTLERVRLVSSMNITNISPGNSIAFPVEFVGNCYQAIALIDLIYHTAPRGRFALIIGNLAGMPANPGLRVDMPFAGIIKSNNGFIEVTTDGEIYTLIVEWNTSENTMHCLFGYSPRGITVNRRSGGGINVNFSDDIIPKRMAELSLFKMYKLTGNPKFLDPLGVRQEMIAMQRNSCQSRSVDPQSYYSTLGLNPYVGKFMTDEMIETMIKFIKRGLAAQLHPDANQNGSSTNLEYLKTALIAADFLSDTDKRREYTDWL